MLGTISYVLQQMLWMLLIAVQLVRAMGLGSGKWMFMTARVFIFGFIVGLYFIPHVFWYIITPTILRRVQYRSSEKARLQILQTILQAPSTSLSSVATDTTSGSVTSESHSELLASDGTSSSSEAEEEELSSTGRIFVSNSVAIEKTLQTITGDRTHNNTTTRSVSSTDESGYLGHTVVVDPGSMAVDDEHVLSYLRQSYSAHLAEKGGADACSRLESNANATFENGSVSTPLLLSSPPQANNSTGLVSKLTSSFSWRKPKTPAAMTTQQQQQQPHCTNSSMGSPASDLFAMTATIAEQEEAQKKELLKWAEKKLEDDDAKIHNRATMDIFLPVPLHDLITLKSQQDHHNSSSPSSSPRRHHQQQQASTWSSPSPSRRNNNTNPKKSSSSSPPQPKKFKVLIMVSGGAWIIGCYLWSALIARFFAAAGYVVFVPDYRNFPQTNVGGMVDDVGDAIAWVLKNAEKYNGNIRDVTLMGHSAGAHLTMLTLLQQAQRSATASAQATAEARAMATSANVINNSLNDVSPIKGTDGGSGGEGGPQLVSIIPPSSIPVTSSMDMDPLTGSLIRGNGSFLGNPMFGNYPTENNVDVGSSLGGSTRPAHHPMVLSSQPTTPEGRGGGEHLTPISRVGSMYRPGGAPTPWDAQMTASSNYDGNREVEEEDALLQTARTPHPNSANPSIHQQQHPSSLYEVMVNDASVSPKFDPRESIHQYVGVSGIYDMYGLVNYMHARGLYKDVLYKLSGYKGITSSMTSSGNVSPTSSNSPTSPTSPAAIPTPAGIAQAKAIYLKAISPVWFLGDSVASLARRWSPETSEPLFECMRGVSSKACSSPQAISLKEEVERQKEALDDLHLLLAFLPKNIKFVHGKCDKSAPTTESIKMANALAEAIALDTMMQQSNRVQRQANKETTMTAASKSNKGNNTPSSVEREDGEAKQHHHSAKATTSPSPRVATVSVPPPSVELILLNNTNHTDPILEEQLCGSCTLLRVCAGKMLPQGVEDSSVKGNAFLTVTEAAPVLGANKMPLLLRFGRLISAF